MRIERERGEEGRASEHSPTLNREEEEEEEVVKRKRQLEGEKEVKRRAMR